ncbi:MAG: DUF4178 domain-containing protein [Lachnospiraceae bacterium]|nr:DUF4178 domain-containing protein [Lachnospiraceae bacterium]
MGKEIHFYQNQHVIVDGTEYCVIGGMGFYNHSDGSRWMEYRLKSVQGNREKWLSIDNIYQEYALYTACAYSSIFTPEEMSKNGYYQADAGNAKVSGECFGNVDVEQGDKVHYIEYEDRTEEKILAIEQWEDETEYATGYYLDWDEIIPIEGEPEADAYANGSQMKAAKNVLANAICIVAVLAVVIGVIFAIKDKGTIRAFLKDSPNFTYETSITSDINSRKKADVYSTDLSVETAAMTIIQAIDGNTEDVQESDEDNSVAILTKNEYCLVYTDTENITMVQISDRAYVYQSTNTPYRSTRHTHSYYRRFYYARGYASDYGRYGNESSGYEGYDGDTVDTVDTDTADIYRTYSNSVRQSSVNTRSSSGGGISSGK